MKLIWLYALKNLRRYWKKHFLTALGLIFGFVGVLLLGGYMLRMESYLATQTIYLRSVGHFSLWAQKGPTDYFKDPESHLLNLENATKIINQLKENHFDVVRSIPVLKGTGMLTNGCDHFPVLISGLDPEDQKWAYSHPEVQKWIPELTQFATGSGLWSLPVQDSPAMVPPVLYAMLLPTGQGTCQNTLADARPFLQVYTQPFGGGLGISDLTISGRISSGFEMADQSSLVTSRDVLKRIMNTDQVTFLSVFLADPSQLQKALAFARKIAPANIEVESYKNPDVSEVYVGAMNFVYVMLSFFVVLVCGVVILTILNSFQIAFMERRSEIATLKAVGFKAKNIHQIFLAEYFLLNTASLFVGILLALAIGELIRLRNWRFHIPGFANDLQFLLKPTPLFILAVSVCFYILVLGTCYLLSRRSAGTKIVDLLRSEAS